MSPDGSIYTMEIDKHHPSAEFVIRHLPAYAWAQTPTDLEEKAFQN